MLYNIIKELFSLAHPSGFSESEIAEVKRMYGKIPYALECYYRELGRENEVNHTQNNLVVPWKRWQKNETHLIIYTENQWFCCWGISLNDLAADNPPVYVSYDEKTWELESNSVSDFLIAMAHLHAGFVLPFTNKEIYGISEKEAAIIRAHFAKKCEPTMQWLDGGIEFYGNHACDSIVMMRRNAGDYDLSYASGNKTYFKEMDKILSTLGEAY